MSRFLLLLDFGSSLDFLGWLSSCRRGGLVAIEPATSAWQLIHPLYYDSGFFFAAYFTFTSSFSWLNRFDLFDKRIHALQVCIGIIASF